jgi:hypothetical protein
MRPDQLERRLRERLVALGPAPRAELLHVLMLPDFDRVDRIGEFWGYPGSRAFAELLIDLEEDKAARRSCSGCSGRWSGSRQAARRAGYFETVPASAAALGPHGPGRRISMMGVLICLRLHWVWFVGLTARSLSRFGLGPLSG